MSKSTADQRVADIVRTGKIRVALFLPQYSKDAATGEIRGIGMGIVAIELGCAIATRLGLELVLMENPTPPSAVESLRTGGCDLMTLGIEPSRQAVVDFSPPIVEFDYSFLLPAGSPINTVADADRPGIRIAVVRNHASTFTLARQVKHAELLGSDLPDSAFDMLRAKEVDAFAAPREQLLDYAANLPGSRVMEQSFGINSAGLAVAKGQAGRLAYISEFVEDAKASGLVQGIIERGGLRGFRVAPRADLQGDRKPQG